MDWIVSLVNMFEDKNSPYAKKEIRELEDGIIIRRPHSFEKKNVLHFIAHNFRDGWCDEVEPAFSHIPCQCVIATTKEGEVIGFASYDVLRRGMFGPIGTNPEYRKKGVGGALLIECLRGLYNLGFAYGFIGGKNPNAANFYAHYIGNYSTPIPNSDPGVYRYPMFEHHKDCYKDNIYTEIENKEK